MTALNANCKYLTESFRSGDRVFVAGLTGESALLRDELSHFPERADNITFTSVQLPGIDKTDYLSFHPNARVDAFFMTPALRAGLASGRANLHPLDYTGITRFLHDSAPFDYVIGQFTAPDEQGWCFPGLSSDFTPVVWQKALHRLGHINPALPRVKANFKVHISEFDAVVEQHSPLLNVMESLPNEVSKQIGKNAAELIFDGDTLQMGIGSAIPDIANELHSHRRLRLHSGMISPFLRTLWENGSLDRDARIVTGVIFGDEEFYDYVGSLDRLRLNDVRYTHNIAVLSSISRLVAINSAVEVDLFGQVNSERSQGSVLAGSGGLPAFALGSQIAQNGRLLICLSATARAGKISRIVPVINSEGICTLPRHLADAVVTEFGIAQLRGKSMAARAEALISIAHPNHRPALAQAWATMENKI